MTVTSNGAMVASPSKHICALVAKKNVLVAMEAHAQMAVSSYTSLVGKSLEEARVILSTHEGDAIRIISGLNPFLTNIHPIFVPELSPGQRTCSRRDLQLCPVRVRRHCSAVGCGPAEHSRLSWDRNAERVPDGHYRLGSQRALPIAERRRRQGHVWSGSGHSVQLLLGKICDWRRQSCDFNPPGCPESSQDCTHVSLGCRGPFARWRHAQPRGPGSRGLQYRPR